MAATGASTAALLAFLALPYLCAGLDDIPFWMSYADGPYLNTFSVETFTGPNGTSSFPSAWWDVNLDVCPGVGQPGYIGVTCSQTPSGASFATSVDLSRASLPSTSQRLTGSFQVPPFIVGLQFLQTLNLSGQGLTGQLPGSISYAPKLKNLDLQGNQLNGTISPDLCSLNLTCLNFANNNFTGTIPSCLKNPSGQFFPCVDFQGNPGLSTATNCDSLNTFPSCWPKQEVVYAPPPPPAEVSNNLPIWAIVLIVLGSLFLVAAIVGAAIVLQRHMRKQKEIEEKRMLTERIESELTTRRFGVLKRFTAEELAAACNGFDDDNYLGEGGFSTVYKGKLEDGTEVAVKKMKMDQAKGGGVELSFINEVEVISRASHKNLAQSLGFCVEAGENLMLALKFYANGSVANRTRGKEGDPLLWFARRKIAKGAAEGVAYLHGDCDPMIIHRDIKAENILLDNKDDPVVADFGLATEMDPQDTGRNTGIQGTLGHIAPEYFMSGKCSVKTDVYAFGVFLLELVSGKDIFTLTADSRAEDLGLHDWLLEIVESEKIAILVDPELHQVLEEDADRSMLEVLRVATLCVRNDASERPTMDQVSGMLSEGQGLAGNWARWQAEAGRLTGEDMLRDISNPAAWDNMTTGVGLDPSTLQGARR